MATNRNLCVAIIFSSMSDLMVIIGNNVLFLAVHEMNILDIGYNAFANNNNNNTTNNRM